MLKGVTGAGVDNTVVTDPHPLISLLPVPRHTLVLHYSVGHFYKTVILTFPQ